MSEVNEIQLSTAVYGKEKSEKRSKEVVLRKVVGAKKIQLIKQFFFESTIFTIHSVSHIGTRGVYA